MKKPSGQLQVWFKQSQEETKKAGGRPSTRLIGLINQVGLIEAMTQSVKKVTSGREKAVNLEIAREWSLEAGVIKFAEEFDELTVAYARVALDQMLGGDDKQAA